MIIIVVILGILGVLTSVVLLLVLMRASHDADERISHFIIKEKQVPTTINPIPKTPTKPDRFTATKYVNSYGTRILSVKDNVTGYSMETNHGSFDDYQIEDIKIKLLDYLKKHPPTKEKP